MEIVADHLIVIHLEGIKKASTTFSVTTRTLNYFTHETRRCPFFVVSGMNPKAASFHLLVIKTNQLPEQLVFYMALDLSFEHHHMETAIVQFASSSG
jgi:hypothetical protein